MKPYRRNKNITYSIIMGEHCANPWCEDGMDIETHHIIPLQHGGEDKFWNLIRLCKKCHRGSGLHRNWDEMSSELFNWKCIQELEVLGFILDENDEDFELNKRNALNMAIRR